MRYTMTWHGGKQDSDDRKALVGIARKLGKDSPEHHNQVRDNATGQIVFEHLALWIPVKVTYDSGESYETQIRGPIEVARAYFMQAGGYTEDGQIVTVEQTGPAFA